MADPAVAIPKKNIGMAELYQHKRVGAVEHVSHAHAHRSVQMTIIILVCRATTQLLLLSVLLIARTKM